MTLDWMPWPRRQRNRLACRPNSSHAPTTPVRASASPIPRLDMRRARPYNPRVTAYFKIVHFKGNECMGLSTNFTGRG